jgi:hypothetical protein
VNGKIPACNECKHFEAFDFELPEGNCTKFKRFDLVTGWENQDARTLRNPGKDCGLMGTGFEPRPLITRKSFPLGTVVFVLFVLGIILKGCVS